jgi:hypothetical protein
MASESTDIPFHASAAACGRDGEASCSAITVSARLGVDLLPWQVTDTPINMMPQDGAVASRFGVDLARVGRGAGHRQAIRLACYEIVQARTRVWIGLAGRRRAGRGEAVWPRRPSCGGAGLTTLRWRARRGQTVRSGRPPRDDLWIAVRRRWARHGQTVRLAGHSGLVDTVRLVLAARVGWARDGQADTSDDQCQRRQRSEG